MLGFAMDATGMTRGVAVVSALILLELPLLAGVICMYWRRKSSSQSGQRFWVPGWAICGLLPLPALVLLRSGDGSGVALWLFFIGSTGLVAQAFARHIHPPAAASAEVITLAWRHRLRQVSAALLAAFLIFSATQLALKGTSDLVEIALAFLILIPSLGVVPYFTLTTRNPFSAVVLAIFSVACMKFLGCIVVVLVYGWDASSHGYTSMPWMSPNLLVWLFWLNMTVLCSLLYHLGKGRFRVIHCPVA